MRRWPLLVGYLTLFVLSRGGVVSCESPTRTYPQKPMGTAFVEEFNADELSATLFRPIHAGRYWDSWLDGSLVTLTNGLLVVSGRATGTSEELPKVGGVVSTAYYSYGWFTFWARASLAKGMVAALHLYNEDRDRYASGRHEEVDLELSSDAPDVISWDTYHDDDWTNDVHQNAMHRGNFSRTQHTPGLEEFDSRRFNTYAIEWHPDHVSWFINGVQIATATDAIPTVPLRIRLDLYHNRRWDEWLGIKPSGAGTLQADWVRFDSMKR